MLLKKADYAKWQSELWIKTNPTTQGYYAQKYLSKIRTVFLTFLDWVEETYDLPNYLKAIKKPIRREPKHEMSFWEFDEFQTFIHTIDDCVWKTFFMLLFYTGCRIGEVVALSDGDINEKSITINKSYSRKVFNKKERYVITPPKTQSSYRTIEMPKILIKQIKLYLTYKKEKNITSTFLFGGDKPLSDNSYQRAFNKYIKLSGVKKIRIHDLRHSHASLLIQNNVPITTISKRLGHSSVKMTLDTYSHCYKNSDNEATLIIDNLFPDTN